jgi:beta-glucanase (GH16 family)
MKSVFLIFFFLTPFLLYTSCFSEVILSDSFEGVSVTFPDGRSKLYPDPDKWAFTFLPGTKWPDSYGDGTNWLNGNNECQTYVTPFITQIRGFFIPRELRYDPFEIKEDGLHIQATLLSKEQRLAYQTEVAHRRFGSGMLLSKKSFLYGRFRLIGKMPKAKGTWPAFWLLPSSFIWPPEIDIFEIMAWGRKTREIHSGFFPPISQGKPSGKWYKINQSLTTDFNEYGLNWDQNTVSVSFNGEKLWSTNTPNSLKQPMYILVTLTIGGNWPFNELQVLPIDCRSPSRLAAGADLIENDYPASLILKSITVEKID